MMQRLAFARLAARKKWNYISFSSVSMSSEELNPTFDSKKLFLELDFHAKERLSHCLRRECPPPNKVLGRLRIPIPGKRAKVLPAFMERVSHDELMAAVNIICDRIRNKEMTVSDILEDWAIAYLSDEAKKRLLSLESQKKENLRERKLEK